MRWNIDCYEIFSVRVDRRIQLKQERVSRLTDGRRQVLHLFPGSVPDDDGGAGRLLHRQFPRRHLRHRQSSHRSHFRHHAGLS